MAEIEGVLSSPVMIDELDLIQGIPVGPLFSPYILDEPPIGPVEIITNRFPVPPTAAGFLTMPTDADGNDAIRLDSRIFGDPLIGVLFPESRYLEPTIGQIWPR